MNKIVAVRSTIHAHTRTRIYDADNLDIKAGEPVLVLTRVGGLLLGEAVADSDQVNEREEELIRKYLGIGQGDFLPVLQVFRDYTPEKIAAYMAEEDQNETEKEVVEMEG